MTGFQGSTNEPTQDISMPGQQADQQWFSAATLREKRQTEFDHYRPAGHLLSGEGACDEPPLR